MSADEINNRYQDKVAAAKAAIDDPLELRLYMRELLDAWRFELEAELGVPPLPVKP